MLLRIYGNIVSFPPVGNEDNANMILERAIPSSSVLSVEHCAEFLKLYNNLVIWASLPSFFC